MQLDRKDLCPLLKKQCIKLECAWFMQLRGTDPQEPGKEIDHWGCAIVFTVLGQLENAKRIAGGFDGLQKATESYRNETVRGSKEVISGLAALVQESQQLVRDVAQTARIEPNRPMKEITHARDDQSR
jgi:hypothetical protein